MKTITIKLPEDEARELEEFIKNKNYPSKSEFIRHLIMEKLEIVMQLTKIICLIVGGYFLYQMLSYDRQQLELLDKILDICSL